MFELLRYFHAQVSFALIVIKVGYSLAKDSSTMMLEQVLSKEEAQKFNAMLESIDGVLKIDQMRARTHGHYVIIDVKVSVDASLSVGEGHRIGKTVKHELIEKHKVVKDVLVHINPYPDTEE